MKKTFLFILILCLLINSACCKNETGVSYAEQSIASANTSAGKENVSSANRALSGKDNNSSTNKAQVAEKNKKSVTIKIVNWNTETFFDCKTEGTEYSDFIKNAAWNKDAYIKRIERLVSVIKQLDADVFVMEEIENEGVMYDISNFLAGEWNSKKIYAYGCFAKETGSSIGCGVLSRFPLSNMKVHGMDIRSEEEGQPSTRPIIEVTVIKNDEPLTLFVNHWKSKSGGAEESEKWRMWQEKILASKCELSFNNGDSFAATGDFNCDIEEFTLNRKNGTVMLGDVIEVYAPWYQNGNLVEPGSYFFQGNWNRIDHFFISCNSELISFSPETDGQWCDSETKKPFAYSLWNGNGYSDHLPVCAVFRY